MTSNLELGDAVVECDYCHEDTEPEQRVLVNGVPVHVDCLDAVLDAAISGMTTSYRKYFNE